MVQTRPKTRRMTGRKRAPETTETQRGRASTFPQRQRQLRGETQGRRMVERIKKTRRESKTKNLVPPTKTRATKKETQKEKGNPDREKNGRRQKTKKTTQKEKGTPERKKKGSRQKTKKETQMEKKNPKR